jgi:glucose/mannose-6-phosphate isomerase
MNYDPSNLRKIILDFPKQFMTILDKYKDISIEYKGIKKILVCGMGGSAFPGDVIFDYLKGEMEIHVSRGYHVPSWVNKDDTLVIASSYSGNTEESLSSLADALVKGYKIAVVTAGGKLKEQAIKNNLPLIEVPSGIPPRSATGYFFTAFLILSEKVGLTSGHANKFAKLEAFLSRLDIEDSAKEIALSLKGTLPIVYSSHNFTSIAKIWKIKFNEHSKQQAFFNVFPELNHNELIGWTTLVTNPHFIFLRHKKDYPRIQQRMDVSKEILIEKKLPVTEIWMDGESLLEQMFYTIYLGDFVAYHLALLNKIDPFPVDLIEDFKKRLEELF